MPNGLGACGRTMLERALGQEARQVGATWREMLMELVVLQSTAGSVGGAGVAEGGEGWWRGDE